MLVMVYNTFCLMARKDITIIPLHHILFFSHTQKNKILAINQRSKSNPMLLMFDSTCSTVPMKYITIIIIHYILIFSHKVKKKKKNISTINQR